MGNKDSRPVTISYEEAVRRVTDLELKRLKDVFKRCAPSNYMSREMFGREVLGEGWPSVVGDQIFSAFGGTSRGITFKDLLTSLVLVTRGKDEEIYKFVFGLYANDALQIDKETIDRTVLKTEGVIPDSLCELFERTDKVDYETFKIWLRANPDFTSVSSWLVLDRRFVTLSNDMEMPTFYQTLAGVTHLEEREIIELEKRYWNLKANSLTGRFDYETFRRLVHPPVPAELCESFFLAFDENRDDHIDFKELVCGISACCRGPEVQRQKFCFRVFDTDHDGFMNLADILRAIEASFELVKHLGSSASVSDLLSVDAVTMAKEVLQSHDSDRDNRITQEEYLVWAVESSLPKEFHNLLMEVCHILLGLQPASREDEGRVINGWLRREQQRGLRLGQTCYLVASTWWKRWTDYVSDNVAAEAIELNDDMDALTVVETDRTSYSLAAGSSVLHPPRPAAIDNSWLVTAVGAHKVPTLTNEGGALRGSPRLVRGQDYEVLPEELWKAIHSWYSGQPALPRPVIVGKPTADGSPAAPELELYQYCVRLLRHQMPAPQQTTPVVAGIGGVAGGIANFALTASGLSSTGGATPTPKRVLVHTACFSRQHTLKQVSDFLWQRLRIGRDDLRLWKYDNENSMSLLEGDDKTMEELGVRDNQQLLVEVRNKDLTWPEEMLQVVKRRTSLEGSKQAQGEQGVSGLSNLGNTCFMNAALQCVSNTHPLRLYFTAGMHLYELNRSNPLGMKGHVALTFGELIQNIWSGSHKSLIPLKMRFTLTKYAPQFNGFQQHDSQELLAFLLDGLHEDLNRVQVKPYTELKDSDGRLDAVVAQEAWDNHLLRNRSVVVDLFHGQLKSEVRCKDCGHISARFDPFTYLSLPLPMEACIYVEVTLVRMDGSIPVRYGLCLSADDRYNTVSARLCELAGLAANTVLLADVAGAKIRNFPASEQKIKPLLGGCLYAYEIPPSALAGSELSSILERRNTAASVQTCSSSLDGGEVDLADSSSTLGSMVVVGPQTLSEQPLRSGTEALPGFVVVMHRKMERREHYFLSPQKSIPVLFGSPLVLQTTSMTNRKLYEAVWAIVARFLTAKHSSRSSDRANHAEDCDNSFGLEHPFVLKHVNRDGICCSRCPYYRFCRGCRIECNDDLFDCRALGGYVAIDWEPTALHLRYQHTSEVEVKVDPSVAEAQAAHAQPISLDACLQAFTQEEQLGAEELYYCSKCKQHRLASKRLQIWRLPPILIVHLKRFQLHNGRWIKSHKMVTFPFDDFDPGHYMPRPSFVNGNGQLNGYIPSSGIHSEESTSQQQQGDIGECDLGEGSGPTSFGTKQGPSGYRGSRVSKTKHPPFALTASDIASGGWNTKYRLYAVSCHRGQLGGGHYVAYAKNPNDKWYEFNDSMVKEAAVNHVDSKSAYILFYERHDFDYGQVIPDIRDRNPDVSDYNEDYNREFKSTVERTCSVQ